jgi:hypothetical protein
MNTKVVIPVKGPGQQGFFNRIAQEGQIFFQRSVQNRSWDGPKVPAVPKWTASLGFLLKRI